MSSLSYMHKNKISSQINGWGEYQIPLRLGSNFHIEAIKNEQNTKYQCWA